MLDNMGHLKRARPPWVRIVEVKDLRMGGREGERKGGREGSRERQATVRDRCLRALNIDPTCPLRRIQTTNISKYEERGLKGWERERGTRRERMREKKASTSPTCDGCFFFDARNSASTWIFFNARTRPW
jgi:hypothetical protein